MEAPKRAASTARSRARRFTLVGKRLRGSTTIVAAAFSLLLGAVLLECGPSVPDPCRGSEMPEVLLGQGVGGAFVELTDNQDVGLSVAPQGGFGIPVVVQTHGLSAGDLVQSRVLLEVLLGDGTEELLGTFETRAPLQCRSDGEGGNINGVVVGFDPDRYRTNDDLLALDGQIVELRITVTDEDGRVAVATKPVTMRVGG